MRTSLTSLVILWIALWVCPAQDLVSDTAKSGSPDTDRLVYYSTINRRVLEFRTQVDLLNQMAQEHKKRAIQTPGDQARSQWESELAKELGEKAAAVIVQLNNTTKERQALEQAHPELASAPGGSPSKSNPDERTFMEKLEERVAAVQQDIIETTEGGKLYRTQLLTNTAPYDFSRISALIQENGTALRQLQKELTDLELRKLEFRALRRD